MSIVEELKQMEADSTWVANSTDKLKRQGYSDKFVAVDNKKVIASGKDLETLIKTLEKQGKNAAELVIEFIPKKEMLVVL